MDKKQKNILVWILTWAGLLVAVLYSPVGSPDLYSSKQYYSPNQGVSFNGDPIFKSHSVSNDNGGQAFSVPVYESKRNFSYSVSNAGNTSVSQGIASVSTNAAETNRSNGSGGMSSGGGLAGFGTGSNASGASNQSPGLIAMSTDLTFADNSLTKQSGNTYTYPTAGAGATDPGDEPTGPPIPVGDGWIYLLALATGYAVWKKIRL